MGFMGASKGPFNNEEGVSDIYVICAPASSRSFTENWHLLRTMGSVLPWSHNPKNNLTNIKGRRAWGNLNSAMHQAYTVRSNAPKGQMIRPLPMKFCPPNYIMDGINVKVYNHKGIAGIVALHCRKSFNPHAQEPKGDDEILVYLDAEVEDSEGFTIFGKPYTLSQRLGNLGITTQRSYEIEVRCPNNGFISGLEMTHDHTGLLEHLHPKCTAYPL